MKKSRRRKIMWIALFIIATLLLSVLLFINQKSFGKTPSGQRKERVKNSPNYRDGKFQNQNNTPQFAEDAGYISTMTDFLFGDHKRVRPTVKLPSVKTDLHKLDRNEDVLIWLGHSSYFLQVDGKRFLVDPVLNGAASPVSFINKPFDGTDVYDVEDIPDVDYLFITHDHWDHLDYKTVMDLKGRIGKVVCGLGVAEHFEYWGFDLKNVVELDWNENAALDEGFVVCCLPARHFSGRGLSPNQSLWASFLVQTPTFKFYIGGDSGYDTHYAEIGKRFNNIDLAILENGQYDNNWKYIHMMPEEVLQATKDLRAKAVLPVHNSKYTLANHSWDDPLVRITEANKIEKQNVLTPMIGEPVNLKDSLQVFSQWWINID